MGPAPYNNRNGGGPISRRRQDRRDRAIALAVAVSLGLLGGSCGGPAPAVRPSPPLSVPPRTTPSAPAGPAAQLGMATYYASRFAGRRTASGERYNPNALTAAHRTLPMGTVVRVTRIDREGNAVAGPVVVRVNDRGPYAAGRVIDLSLAAARRLGMLRAGVVRVRIEILSRPTR
jgi:rare lipoprotein A